MPDQPSHNRHETPAGRGDWEGPASRRPNHYRNGRAFEHRVRADLEANGYRCFRTAGSKTKVDLIAVKHGQVLLIQCKRSGALPTGEWNALVALSLLFPPNTVPVLAVGGRGGRYWELTAPKVKRGERPMRPFIVDAAA